LQEVLGLKQSSIDPRTFRSGFSDVLSENTIEEDEHTILVLVDFDNVFGTDSAADFDWVPLELNRVLELAAKVQPRLTRVDIRLYGGWLKQGILSGRASALQAKLSGLGVFPTVRPNANRITRGSVTLATRITAVPGIEWENTLREKRGFPQVRLAGNALPGNCIKPLDCPVETVRRFTKAWDKLCPRTGCTVRNNDAFIALEQKMVDTMLACDVIDAMWVGRASTIIVMSDDADIVPAIAMGAGLGSTKIVLVQSPDRAGSFLSELQPLGVASEIYEVG
jgi:hypothetical protein